MLDSKSLINVTRPFLPPIQEFCHYLEEIWSCGQLTNFGRFHTQLEESLSNFLGVPHLSLVANGTLALSLVIKSLKKPGKIITSPFTFIATASSILWEGYTPVFCDIDPNSFTLDPVLCEALIDEQTIAIMPIHVYGNVSHTEEFEALSAKYGIPIIYDASHSFGVNDLGGSILRHGNYSTLSFHATKAFSTIEGGAIVSSTLEDKLIVDRVRNFGFVNEIEIEELGINAKLNEISAAFGLLCLKYYPETLAKRQKIDIVYRSALSSCKSVTIMPIQKNVTPNYTYFPLIASCNSMRDLLYNRLKAYGINSRRYFYPLVNTHPFLRDFDIYSPPTPVALDLSNRILCLPIYPDLKEKDALKIASIIKQIAE